MIGKVVEILPTGAAVEWIQDQHVRKFFEVEQEFRMWNARSADQYKAGQIVKIMFGNDTRHLRGIKVLNPAPSAGPPPGKPAT